MTLFYRTFIDPSLEFHTFLSCSGAWRTSLPHSHKGTSITGGSGPPKAVVNISSAGLTAGLGHLPPWHRQVEPTMTSLCPHHRQLGSVLSVYGWDPSSHQPPGRTPTLLLLCSFAKQKKWYFPAWSVTSSRFQYNIHELQKQERCSSQERVP